MSFARYIVLDTGVLISAAIRPESVPALALEKAFLQFDVCACQETLAELETVLLRPKFDRYASASRREGFIAGFRSRSSGFLVTEKAHSFYRAGFFAGHDPEPLIIIPVA